ncbi:hypothetical protein L249_8164 [Ophiocordyceps polyrhachis-furcata BCC 54312]|uniref:Uncharacterized protein n=1 Tax=Ophiocordyceps polyrhachis-furcata BCC 54312 TaxID=1330021 RepID=A0A367LHM0_9HYPO|nr:hypothetical protein L249_8164 [Ophiocordyceps polyrhachis-furcata BCC 54312]
MPGTIRSRGAGKGEVGDIFLLDEIEHNNDSLGLPLTAPSPMKPPWESLMQYKSLLSIPITLRPRNCQSKNTSILLLCCRGYGSPPVTAYFRPQPTWFPSNLLTRQIVPMRITLRDRLLTGDSVRAVRPFPRSMQQQTGSAESYWGSKKNAVPPVFPSAIVCDLSGIVSYVRGSTDATKRAHALPPMFRRAKHLLAVRFFFFLELPL